MRTCFTALTSDCSNPLTSCSEAHRDVCTNRWYTKSLQKKPQSPRHVVRRAVNACPCRMRESWILAMRVHFQAHAWKLRTEPLGRKLWNAVTAMRSKARILILLPFVLGRPAAFADPTEYQVKAAYI